MFGFLKYRKNKNPFQKEERIDGHMFGLMGMGLTRVRAPVWVESGKLGC